MTDRESAPRGRDLLSSVVDRLDAPEAAHLDDITVGDAAILVELRRDGRRLAGVAHRPPDDTVLGDPSVETLLGWAMAPAGSIAGVRKAAGVAAVNALSAPRMEWRYGDPMANLPAPVDDVATVGFFAPAVDRFDDVTVHVVERERIETPPSTEGVDVVTYTPADADRAFADADVVFVTGSTLLYGGFGRYLTAAPAGVPVTLIGATASFLPEVVFDAGVTVLAGAEVADADAVRAAVAAGGCGSALHDAGLRKGYVRADTRPAVAPGGPVDTDADTDTDTNQ
ncbi:MAG: Rossmann-like domain-containing protein [Halobacteriota archaeon]|uniref:Rossmann-like domain-containing protein n=1 Tax=Natronomonas sp. TaxID=2184060 RepID=UPI003976E26F